MDFTFTTDARELAAAARDVLSGIGRTVIDPVLGRAAFDGSRWAAVAELGLPALRCPDPIGFDLGLLEASLVAENVGAVLFPEPVLEVAVLAGMLANGHNDVEGDLLRRVAEGEFVSVDLHAESDQGVLKVRAPFLAAANTLVAVTEDRVLVFDAPAPTDVDAADPTRIVDFACLPTASALTAVDVDRSRIQRMRNERTVLLGAELVGAMQSCLDQTLDYLREREQFGKPIGTFQALKHQCADMFATVEQARALTRLATISIDQDVTEASALVSGVAAFVPAAAVEVAGQCVHLFGAMGFAWETGIHLVLRRGLTARTMLGDRRAHQLAVLESMMIGGSAASA